MCSYFHHIISYINNNNASFHDKMEYLLKYITGDLHGALWPIYFVICNYFHFSSQHMSWAIVSNNQGHCLVIMLTGYQLITLKKHGTVFELLHLKRLSRCSG